MMDTDIIIDDYITAEPKSFAVGHCNCCGHVIEDTQDYIKLKSGLYCNEECVSNYYEAEEITLVEYCLECDKGIVETYLKDVYDNKFCNLKCLIDYYKNH